MFLGMWLCLHELTIIILQIITKHLFSYETFSLVLFLDTVAAQSTHTSDVCLMLLT